MMGLEQFMIWEEGSGNLPAGDAPTGYRLRLGLPFYRALPLSCIEDYRLTVDGEPVDGADMRLEIQGKSLSVGDLPPEYEDLWWNVDRKADLIVSRLGGLSTGEHTVEVFMKLRWEILKPVSFDPEQGPMFDETTAFRTLEVKQIPAEGRASK